ncbi:hypothetical protein E3N88_25020 [Mikania micrantha]|uniref:Serine/threonine-protein phosphatase 2A 55 kDa regulatory subunit B n=1 Tax=Mikania micrantha TaxID=192012 RepID=A0A5N6N4I1_9ASTR|nr:hypothetical protein E3N88_25020 [Mikania micrantha]
MEVEDDVDMAGTEGLDWKFSQVFGERAAGEEVQEADIISAIEFDKSGDLLATGDRGGRVVLFERTDRTHHADNRRCLEGMDCFNTRHPEFHYKTEFQSHEPEFDYLKSLEIEEQINQIRWCHTANGAMFLLSTNNKTIKCWKVHEKKIKKICHMNIEPHKSSHGFLAASKPNAPTISKPHTSNGDTIDNHSSCMKNNISLPSLHLPMVISHETNSVAKCKRTFAHAHDFNINSISTNRLEEHVAPGSRSFFTDIIGSISDIKFAKGGRHILSRDYMTLKLWDINMDSGPVATFQVHEYLRPKLCDMYENDSIFDKFDCCLRGDGQMAATGSYSNLFRIFGCTDGSTEETTLEATKNPTKRQIQTPSRFSRSPGTLPRVNKRGSDNSGIDINGSIYDFSMKLLHLAWHPNENLIACAASNSLNHNVVLMAVMVVVEVATLESGGGDGGDGDGGYGFH